MVEAREVCEMLLVKLNADQQQKLQQLSRRAVGRVALRAQMVLLSYRGYGVPAIATIHACGQDVVRTWLHRFQRAGVAGLTDEPRSGRPLKDPLAKPIVDAQASQSPRCSGHVQACWTVGLLAAFLAQRFHLILSASSVRRALHALDWRWARPRLAPASVLRRKRDPATGAKLAALAQAQQAAAAGLARWL